MSATVFEITVEGLAPGLLRVSRFEGYETMTRPYRFDIDVVSKNHTLPLDEMLGRRATLTLSHGQTRRPVHGILHEVSTTGEADGGEAAYRLCLMPRLALLELTRHNRSFGSRAPMTVLEVIEALLRDSAGLGFTAADYSTHIQDRSAYHKRDFWVQYGESDADFLHRLLEHWGLFYYFDQDERDGHEHLVITDAAAALPAQTPGQALSYRGPHTGAAPHGQDLQTIHRSLRTIPKSVRLKDYSSDHPHLTLVSEAAVRHGGFGEYDDYGAHFMTPSEGDFLARVRAEEVACRRDSFALTTVSPFIAAGHIVAVEGHARADFNQRYLPVTIHHRGQQNLAGAFAGTGESGSPVEAGYHNRIEAVPASAPYRSPRLTPRPRMNGVNPATIEVDESRAHLNRAAIDAQGRYKVALDFDTAETPNYERSPFLRRMQPYAGPDVGFHFPLLKQTEVMIGWVDGDPDRPFILGAMPNAESVGPVARANHTENKLRTASGIALVMNDGPGTVSAATAGAAPAAARSGGHGTAGHGVYSALLVPSGAGGPAHYLRLGDAAADTAESQILASPLFAAGDMAHRGKGQSQTDYAGIFSYTGQNRTSATGGHETLSTAGDLRQIVGGSHSSAIYGRKPPPNGIYTPATDDSWAASFSSAHRPIAINCNTDAYTAMLSYVPNITYCDSAQTNFTLGISYTFVGGLNLAVNLGGVFNIQCAPMVEVGTVYEYTLDNEGGMGDGTNFLDSDFSFYATDPRGIVLGYRGVTGTAYRTAAAAVARKAMGFSFAGGLVGEAGQGSVIAQQSLLNEKSSILGSIAQGTAITPATISYGACLGTVKSFFDSDIEELDTPNGAGEATLSIKPSGITLQALNSQIQVTEDIIFIHIGNNGLMITSDGVQLVAGSTSILLNTSEITIDAPETIVMGETLTVNAMADIANDLNVQEDIIALGNLSATNIIAGI
jgi:type VI secretion system VgrG family protein